jgi:hypothetical protein
VTATSSIKIGDNVAHGEEAYALWGDSERFDVKRQEAAGPRPWSKGVAEMADQQLGEVSPYSYSFFFE